VRRTRIAVAGLAVSGLFAVMACSASALTLGTTTFPSGAKAGGCMSGFFVQTATDSSYQYEVPSGGGQISSWSASTSEAAPGTPLTLLLLRHSGTGYKVVGFDSETLPNPLPVSGIATFNISSPITVTGEEVLGLYSSAATVACYFSGGTIPAADTISAQLPAGPPSVGTVYTPTVANAPGFLINVSAELTQSLDAGIAGSAAPATVTAGGAAEYAFTVSNSGVSTAPVTFTDAVPGGLTILSAVAGSGICSTAGPTVTCTISGLHPGSSAPVSIIVSAPTAGKYADAATVAASLTDPNPANNVAVATLTVNAPPAPPPAACKTIALGGYPLSLAKLVIPALNCTVGKVTSKASKTVHKGLVISTSPGAGATLAAGSAVNIVTSSGPPKKKKKKKKKH
jgi:uncharacterized repeat protein (TIGR01451 family)